MRTRIRRLARRYLPPRVRRRLARLLPSRPAAPRRKRPPRRGPRPREALLRSLERGRSLDDAVVVQVRALLAADDHDAALSLAESLRSHAATRMLGDAAAGIAAFRRGYVELAWEHLGSLPREVWADLAPSEYVRCGLAVAREETLDRIRRLVADDPADMRARAWFEVLGPVHGLGEAELARAVFAIFDRHVRDGADGWRDGTLYRDWMRPWVAADPDSPTAPGTGRPSFAVMDYGHPGAKRGSANIGDHIQTIAALGHVVRHRGVRLHGDQELVELLARLGSRTRPEAQRHDAQADVDVLTVHRDASIYEAIPEGTWALCFGWYMHALFRIRYGFPLHRSLRPIFVSFHCNKRDLLTPEAVEYLKRYGPVGCRDWTTVYLLLSLGVPAFFSGCVTTTIDMLFPDLASGPRPGAPVAYVDMPPADVPRGGVEYAHSSDAVRRRSFAENVGVALDLLDTYRRRHRRVVTSRLHCYLPLRSIGMDVEFRPENRANVRYDGLVGIGDEAFDAIRRGLTGKLERLFGAILEGRPEADVYALWRELTADGVAAAEARRSEGASLPEVAVRGRLDRVVARTVARGDPPREAIHVAVVVRKGRWRNLAVLVASLLEHASRPLHVWVLGLPGTRAIPRRMAARFPRLSCAWVPIGPFAGVMPLPLADLLPGADRAVVLPLPAVAAADVAELADLDLGGHALAAPTQPHAPGISGFGVIHAAADRLGDRTGAAADLRRTAHARHRFDFDAFTGDVLVLDLARLRRERLTETALPVAQGFGLDGLETLHYIAGPDRAEVPARWAVVPTRTPVRDPALVYWADGVKPWQRRLTPERERWRRVAAAL